MAENMKKELEKLSCSTLATMCKNRSIKYYNGKNRFKKAEMVEALLEAEGKQENKKAPKKQETPSKSVEGKQKYLNSLSKGMIVAFREKSGKLNTAAVKSIVYSEQGAIELVHLETQYKKLFHVKPTSIVWVKTNGRFPKGIYLELKGKGAGNEEESKNKR